MKFTIKTFESLTPVELYAVLQLRAEVFVVEQNCVYQDLDNKDQEAFHVLGRDENDDIQAYTRIIPPGISFVNFVSIGRVVNSKILRGKGTGKKLMEFSIKSCKLLFPGIPIKISAQTYLLKFYNDLGFKEVGEGYFEDGIPHIGMIFQDI